MGKVLCGVVVVVLLCGNLAAETISYSPSPERKFSGSKLTEQRRAAYASLRLTRAVEKLERTYTPSHEPNCSPNRLNVLTDARGKAKHRAVMIKANMERAARLAQK